MAQEVGNLWRRAQVSALFEATWAGFQEESANEVDCSTPLPWSCKILMMWQSNVLDITRVVFAPARGLIWRYGLDFDDHFAKCGNWRGWKGFQTWLWTSDMSDPQPYAPVTVSKVVTLCQGMYVRSSQAMGW